MLGGEAQVATYSGSKLSQKGGPGPSRFLVVRDRDGRRIAVARNAVSAVGETEDGGSFLVLPGGRTIVVDETLDHVMQWLG